jgi:hypothetical protein
MTQCLIHYAECLMLSVTNKYIMLNVIKLANLIAREEAEVCLLISKVDISIVIMSY